MNNISKNKQKLNEINQILKRSMQMKNCEMNYTTSFQIKETKENNKIDPYFIGSLNNKIIKTNKIKHFDKIYIINKNNNLDYFYNKFNINNIKIIKKVNIKNNQKLLNKWLYQLSHDNKYISKEIFNYKSYILNNPKLKNLNIAQAWNHYINIGRNKNYIVFKKTQIIDYESINILLSHINAINDAISNNYKSILILEDNANIKKNYDYLLKEYLNKNEKWDILFLGGNHSKLIKTNILYKALKVKGTYAYALNSNIFKILKELSMNFIFTYDKCLQKMQKFYNCYLFYPNIVTND